MGNKKFKCVGLIIRDRSIAAIEIENNKKGPSITNYSKILLEEGIVANGCIILNKESFQEAVKRMMSNGVGGPIKVSEVMISIPEEKVFSHELRISSDKIGDDEAIREAARDYIPIELSQAIYDYKFIYDENDNKTSILSFMAIQRNIVESIIKTFKEIKIDVVGINVDINCFVRSFHNELNKVEGDFMVLDLNPEQDLFALNSEEDGIAKIVCHTDKSEMIDKLKALFNLSSMDEVREFLIKLRKEDHLAEEQKQSMKESFQEYLTNLTTKITQLVNAAETKRTITLQNIYLTGLLSSLPGVEETLKALLPGIPLHRGVKYTEIPAEIESDALQGIGLCLGDTLKRDKSHFNLLPQHKKDEISLAKISPKLKALSMVLTALLMVFTVQMSMKTVRNYLQYRITSQEVAIYNEQALNPYVTQVARIKQQKKQNEQQILSLLDDAIPVSLVMKDVDSYNQNGITMVNVTYNANPSITSSDISLRAKTANRNETETLIDTLEENPLYTEVESPLSNLVGKGERFISVGLTIDKEAIMEAYGNQLNPPITPEEDNE